MKLEEIKNPKFIKKLKKDELETLSDEIRSFLISSVSKTGGHLSSNLGVVDLTIALHKAFNTPHDKIIFDVGHQCYTHKILTGRARNFKNLRQYNGLSGFQKREESEHDCYEAGHSSTSLSAALGFALARDLKKDNNHVVAVIGDGSIGNGLAYEALNHIGCTDTKLIIILNDNEMSISKNVGALHNTLDQIRSDYGYKKKKAKKKTSTYLGQKILNQFDRVKETLKKFYLKEGYLFEELGIGYYGPINGHDFDEMEKYLEMAKKESKPVLLHVITNKGKGYSYAEEDQNGKWHGISKFDIETGEVAAQKSDLISWSEAISNHLVNLAEKDEKILAITPAMTNGAKLNKFKEAYPKRFIDVGIAEEHALVMANALAVDGMKPFVSIYSTFLQRGYDQIQQDIARMDAPVVIGVDRAGLVGEDGETHQGLFDIAFMNHIPGMTIMAPSSAPEAGDLLYTAFAMNKPCAIRYSRGKVMYQPTTPKMVEVGSWVRETKGKKGIIITYGDFVNKCRQFDDYEVINARFIKPFDEKMFQKCLKSNMPIHIIEEASKIGSLGSVLINYANEYGYTKRINHIAIKDEFIKQGNCDILYKELELDLESIRNNIEGSV